MKTEGGVTMLARTVSVFAACAACFCRAGEISVSGVEISQSPSTRAVTVSYTLGAAPAVVTVDFLTNCVSVVSDDPYETVTNYVSIGEQNFSNVAGDVNRLVSGEGVHTITWRPTRSWPDRVLTNETMKAAVTARSVDDPPDYMVVTLTDTDTLPRVSYYVSTNALPDGGLANDAYRTTRLVMRRIHASGVRWRMGAASGDYSGTDYAVLAREQAHIVTLSEDYFIGIYPVTQGQGAKFGGRGSAFTKYDDSPLRPSAHIHYQTIRGSGTGNGHAVKSGSALKRLRDLTGVDFDLPTDAQWEYACRAGTSTLLYSGETLSNASVYKLGWIYGNSPVDGVRQPHPVGLKLPNAWGIYDMYGNVNEWCLDWYVANLGVDDVVDPVGPTAGSNRVVRGGNYGRTIADWRPTSSNRAGDIENRESDMMGFRLACPVTLKFN